MPRRRLPRKIDYNFTRHAQEPAAPRVGRLAGCSATIATIAAALHNPWFLAAVTLLAGSILCGVVLPAIWSRYPKRQRAARALVGDLLRGMQRRS